MTTQHTPNRRERGQAIILVALMAVALVAFVGLAMDGAHTYEQRRQMQHAADAGALLGARELFSKTNYLIIAAKIYSYTVGVPGGIGNGASDYTATFLPSGNNVKTTAPAASDKCVQVNTVVTYSTYFIGIIGFDSLETRAQAKACWGPLSGGGGLIWPMMVHTPTTPITYGQPITLVNDGTYSSGTFGWACFQNGNCNETGLDTWLKSSYTGPFYVPDFYSSASGSCSIANPSPSTEPSLAIGDCLNPTTGMKDSNKIDTDLSNAVGTIVTVLMYDTASGSGSGALYDIVGFGRFQLSANCWKNGDGCKDSGGKAINQTVVGKFMQYTDTGDVCIGSSCNDFGVDGFTLTN